MDKVDKFLKDNPDTALLVRQVEDLMELHNRLVAEGRMSAYKLMGLEPVSNLIRQVEDLVKLHNMLVAEGRIPAYKLMGLEPVSNLNGRLEKCH